MKDLVPLLRGKPPTDAYTLREWLINHFLARFVSLFYTVTKRVNDLVSPYQTVLFSFTLKKSPSIQSLDLFSQASMVETFTLIASKASYAIRFKAVISNDKNRK
jgi:hypothetical protein